MSDSISVVADTTKMPFNEPQCLIPLSCILSANFAFMEICLHMSDSIIINSCGHGNFCLKQIHISCYIMTFYTFV